MQLKVQSSNTHRVQSLRNGQVNNNPIKSIPVSQNSNSFQKQGYYKDLVSFTADRMSVPVIDFEEYRSYTDARKEYFRKRCKNFALKVDSSQLYNPKELYIPLLNDDVMKKFIETSSIYNKFQDQKIICLGRSPKWFLNASLWMQDGVKDYTFIPFSKNWYRPDRVEGMRRISSAAPAENEEKAYRKFLIHKDVSPKAIVEKFKTTGNKTVITDYIESSKGMCSFLDIMARFAKEQKVNLEDFAKSIQIVGIGSLDYTASFYHDDEEFSVPSAKFPEDLMPYNKQIQQEYHDMDFRVFEQMLLNRNVNECRSTFYPHELWASFNPEKYKTGMISEEKMHALTLVHPANKSDFTPAMKDYRNLLNFRILDYLSENGLLKVLHHSRV